MYFLKHHEQFSRKIIGRGFKKHTVYKYLTITRIYQYGRHSVAALMMHEQYNFSDDKLGIKLSCCDTTADICDKLRCFDFGQYLKLPLVWPLPYFNRMNWNKYVKYNIVLMGYALV